MQQLLRDFGEELRRRAPENLLLLELAGRQSRAAGVADLLLPRLCLNQIARKFAASAPQIDLEGERVPAGATVEDPVERRIGDEATVPIVLPFDLAVDGRE